MDFDELLHHFKFRQTPEKVDRQTLANLIRTERDAREIFAAFTAEIEQYSQGVSSADTRAVEKLIDAGGDDSLKERREQISSQWEVIWDGLDHWGKSTEEVDELDEIQNAFSSLNKYLEALLEVEEEYVQGLDVDVKASKLPPPSLGRLTAAVGLFRALESAWPGSRDRVMVLPSNPGDLPASEN